MVDSTQRAFTKTMDVMSCFGRSCDEHFRHYINPDEAKRAKQRDKEVTRILKDHHKQELKKLKILLLGTGESGKSTITKQMKIIHINGFDMQEKIEKIADIKRNIKESIVVLVLAMQQLGISLCSKESYTSLEFMLEEAGNPMIQHTKEFATHVRQLWSDPGVQECFSRSHEFQLIDCAQYFLDKVEEVYNDDYVPSDQDILRCRVVTTAIQNIEFNVPDGGNQVRFSVFDVGGQQGERKKWIQVFDSVAVILFMVDCGSFDTTLREDPTKNRLLEALEIFEQVWKNRFLRNVSVLLFLNKIDVLAEKVAKGRCIAELVKKYPHIFPDFDSFTASNNEKNEFLDSFSTTEEKKKKGRSNSRPDLHPDVVKTAVYIKHLFMKIVKGEINLQHRSTKQDKEWHTHHSCEYYYTCAVDTNNIQRVLNGCRTLIIRKHLERFGII
ncbi:guanine nucleotide-binding protein G(s) subunit alpha-like [Mytilus trossulus]|uniref:guanine nucleotide-binding protein G(s) subunit alpha-like n=1 Tax=Mytilus trossulus TaxID=6551 RepID=UPI003004AA7A